MKCLNLQVRIKKMVNKYPVDYHPSPSELASRTHTLIFPCTPRVLLFSPEYFEFFLKPVYCTMVAKNVKIHGVKITRKYICESKI